ncbi:MAG: hypothetical protein HY782_13595 [Chloroflexi bacterium]|nr:hypothetical protein [Chloroflexota bacterium]
MLRIGIPRALQFLQSYPLWRTFFEELGAQVVISPPTNREIVSVGAQRVADVTCLPVKVYAGHVVWLRDHGQVDFVFVPAIRSVEWGALHCSKFQGLPDLIHATIPDAPPLLDPGIDVHRYKISPSQAFHRLGAQFTRNPFKVRRAWQRAGEVDAAFRAQIVADQLTYLEALARLYPDDWATTPATRDQKPRLTIALVGHPYCLHDDYISHNLVTRLRALGARVVTSEMVSPEQAGRGIQQTTGQKRWFFEDWMSGAAGHYLLEPNVAGLIAVMAFTCGPDSAMVETMTRRAHALGRPFMSLVLDEHGSATGMITRLEAFVDMLTRRDPAQNALAISAECDRTAPVALPAVLRQLNNPVVGFPRMGTSAIPIKSVFEGIGVRVELGPSLSSRTVSLGVRHAPEFICTPYKYILGNMIEMLESGADTLLYMDGAELCRNSSYTQMLNDVLHDLGYKFELVSTAMFATGGAFALPQFLRQFMPQFSWSVVLREIRLALAKMSALDEMERRVQFIRPREATQGGVDKVWEEGLARVDQARDRDALKLVERDVLDKMGHVVLDPTRSPVKIATTGEYYAVLEYFYNLDIERVLGRLGAEVHRTIMLADWAKLKLILEALGLNKSEIDTAAKPYLRWNIGGEGLVTVGQTVLHARRGFDGLVELLPFTCIPEVTVLNILPRISSDLNLPIISFILDEQSGQAGMKTRLEAFVDLLNRRREIRLAPSQAGGSFS